MWRDLSNWVGINPSWYLVIVFVYPWLDLWFWVRINPAWHLLIMWWNLWCLIWIYPWLDLSYWVWVNPCWNLGWLNISLLLIVVSWSLVVVSWSLIIVSWGLVVVSWSLVSGWSLIVVVIVSRSCLLIPFILVLLVTSFFTLIEFLIKSIPCNKLFYLGLLQLDYHQHHSLHIQRSHRHNHHRLYRYLGALLCLGSMD